MQKAKLVKAGTSAPAPAKGKRLDKPGSSFVANLASEVRAISAARPVVQSKARQEVKRILGL